MYCPSCENLMADDAKFCGRCGMFLNRKSRLLEHLSTNFGWIWRRSWGGFVAGFVGWIIVFFVSRMMKQNINEAVVNAFAGMVCGTFLGTVGGVIEESSYKAILGGILGTVGGALGGLVTIPILQALAGNAQMLPLSIIATWAIGGTFIGATSGLIERDRRKILAGALFGLVGGALGGFLGSVFYGSVQMEFAPKGWAANRLAEGLSGGLVGAVLWFSVGTIEKLYIFRRKEDPKLTKKVCAFCGTNNPLSFWYCSHCGRTLQFAAPRQKMAIPPYRGMERIVNAFKFLSWLFGITGVITTPIIFFVFLMQDFFLAFICSVFSILFSYLMVVGFRFFADLLSALIAVSAVKQQPPQ